MKMKRLLSFLALILVLGLALVPAQVTQAALQTSSTGDCRFGIDISVFGFVKAWIPNESVARYDLTAMGFGYYLDWSATRNPSVPSVVKYLHVLQTADASYAYYMANNHLANLVQSNPGAIWVIGNEPDTPPQDGVTAETYADRYFDYATIIRANDQSTNPRPQITFGTITSITPTRLRYMDYVWTELVKKAGSQAEAAALIDIISPHGYIVNEGLNEWGTKIPTAISQAVENEYISLQTKVTDYHDIFSTTIFKARMISMRQWMKTNGLQNKPLWLTEYGNLLPPYNPPGINNQTADYPITIGYMQQTFDWMYTYKDASIGNPSDGNLLVQKFFWFSMNDWVSHFGGTLVDPLTLIDTPVGTAYKAYDPPGTPPAADLLPLSVSVVPVKRDPADGNKVIFNLTARVRNLTISDYAAPATITMYEGSNLLGSSGTRVGRCGGDGLLSLRVNSLAPNTAHTIRVTVDQLNKPRIIKDFVLPSADFKPPYESYMALISR